MEHFEAYMENKDRLIASMDDTKAKVAELEQFGLDVRESVRKIENAKEIVRNDKVSVVLVGAFSDGKTSVIAGWLNEKMDNMKISSDESSDEILCYIPSSIPEGCQILDTPGLFGDKVGSDENGGTIKLSEKTRRFISEASLILYIVAAKNPIKDSHKQSIKELLKDANKLSTTLFVINRMDDVADVTDEEDFAAQAKIKTENLRGKLLDCGLTAAEAQAARVVCISAAPDGKSIELWQNNREEYLKRSHLPALENMTNEILRNSHRQLITKAGCDVVYAEINKLQNMVRELEEGMKTELLPEQKETLRRNKRDLDDLARRLRQSRADMKNELRALEKEKLRKIRAATIEGFGEIVEDEIGIIPGKEGYRLSDDIDAILERYCNMHSQWTAETFRSLETEYEKQNEWMQVLLSKGLGSMKHIGVEGFKKGIFAGRDLLGKMGKTIKFKPWQVTKMAKFATKALPIISGGLDLVMQIVSIGKNRKMLKEFEKTKDELKASLVEVFEDVKKRLDNDEIYFAEFAPEYGLLAEQIREDEENLRALEARIEGLQAWAARMSENHYAVG